MKNDKNIGRAATGNRTGRFAKEKYEQVHLEGIDLEEELQTSTKFLVENAKKVVNKVNSPDLPFSYSLNPYQGCEHGCAYCYARPTHEFWGYSAGLDFEQKIIVKTNVIERLKADLSQKNWKVSPIVLSGNTDCYQPAERKFQLTRSVLKFLSDHNHPAGIITKNALIQRDIDILKSMAERNLIRVNISLTTLDPQLRRFMEPRTASAQKRLQTIEKLSNAGIPVNIMMAPIIPGLTSSEIPNLLNSAANAGANNASYTLLRLNGSVADVFQSWLRKYYPNKFQKVMNQVQETHGGEISNFSFNSRMKGSGEVSKSIKTLFNWALRKYFDKPHFQDLNCNDFIPPVHSQLRLKL